MLRKITELCLIGLAIIGSILAITYGFYMIFNDKITIGTNNISDQVGLDVKVEAESELSEEQKSAYEERWFLEANYYSNAKNNGEELKELRLNYFTSHKLTSSNYRATGMQLLGEYKGPDGVSVSKNELDSYVDPCLWYYDTTDGISYNGCYGYIDGGVATPLNRGQQFIIKIDNRPFSIQLDKGYTQGWWIFSRTTYYTYTYLFHSVMDAIKSNSAGYGDYYITLDLSSLFSIREFDESGKFKADNVTDIIKNYAVLKFHYDENGATRSSQSMFGKIECNSKYDYTGADFWNGAMVYNLTKEDIKLRYSDVYKGYLISIPEETRKNLNQLPLHELNIDVNLTYGDNIVGFDNYAFSGLKNIITLTLRGENRNLNILDFSFQETEIKTIAHTSGITFTGEFGIEFSEVIL